MTVTATAVEFNPTETNDSGPGVKGDEIAIPTATKSETFLIPVNPVIEAIPFVTAPNSTNGTEDEIFPLSGITVENIGVVDPDGSEEIYLEVEISSLPAGASILADGTVFTTEGTPGFLLIPEADLDKLASRAAMDYSGLFNLSVRGIIRDLTTTGDAEAVSAVTMIAVTVVPVADTVRRPSRVTVNEDSGPVPIGTRLASTTSIGIRIRDNGSGTNNPETETLSQLVRIIQPIPPL